jgi:hypothetical protein
MATAVALSVNDDARMPALEVSSGAACGFVHEKCRSQDSHQLMWL